jgi:hypothetical protein
MAGGSVRLANLHSVLRDAPIVALRRYRRAAEEAQRKATEQRLVAALGSLLGRLGTAPLGESLGEHPCVGATCVSRDARACVCAGIEAHGFHTRIEGAFSGRSIAHALHEVGVFADHCHGRDYLVRVHARDRCNACARRPPAPFRCRGR